MRAKLGYMLLPICCAVFFAGADWLRFRGENGNGLAPQVEVPLQWDATTEKPVHVDWSIPLPGRGCSCPLLIDGRVYLTCVSGYRHDQLSLHCFDAASGQQVWQRSLWATGRTMTHPSISPAAPTPASDGQYLYVSYSTNDIGCFDLDGNVVWLRGLMMDFPNASNSLGLASSLVVAEGVLVAKLENDSQSIAVGLDAATGRTKWVLDRPAISSWTTPVIFPTGEQTPSLILQSAKGLTAYDLHTGNKRWEFPAACSTQASCCVADDVLLVPANGITALRVSAAGKPEVVWENNRLRSYTPTPLAYDGRVYAVSGTILKCADLRDGKLLWQVRLAGRRFSASPVLAGDYLIVFGEDGKGYVVDTRDSKGKIVGGGPLGGKILATPAIGAGGMFVRSDERLWKIALPQR